MFGGGGCSELDNEESIYVQGKELRCWSRRWALKDDSAASSLSRSAVVCCWVCPADDNNPYPTAFQYGNGMVLHFYQQQESSTTKPVHKVINKGLKAYV